MPNAPPEGEGRKHYEGPWQIPLGETQRRQMSLGPMKTATFLQFLILTTNTHLLHSKYNNQMNFFIP